MSVIPALKENIEDIASKIQKTGKKKGATVVELFSGRRASKKGGLSEELREQLILEFRLKARKLGRSILRKWHARMDLEEVDSIVDLSLCEAVRRYDPKRGASFMTFLYYHLKGNLIRAVTAAASANCVPSGDKENQSSGSEQEGKFINAIDVAAALTGHEGIMPDEVLFKKQLVELSHSACSRLDPLEREVVHRIYLQGQQLMDIASSLGYSRCHISRVKKKALETLQQEMSHLLEFEGGPTKQEADVDEAITGLGKDRRVVHRRRPRSRVAKEIREEKAA